ASGSRRRTCAPSGRRTAWRRNTSRPSWGARRRATWRAGRPSRGTSSRHPTTASERTDVAKLAIFVDHDIMIRHFIQSGVFAPLEREHDVVYVFPEHKRVHTDPSTLALPRYRTVAVSNER